MTEHWQAIHLVEGQTVAEFVEQFQNLDKDRTITWSAFIDALKHGEKSPHDGRVHAHLPLTQEKTQ